MWDKKVQPLVKSGKLSVLGVLQEQHPERAHLFMQWKKLSFPLLADPLNTLDVAVVPITLLVDEHGVIRYRNPSEADLAIFLETDYAKAAVKPVALTPEAWEKSDLLAMAGKVNLAMVGYQNLLSKAGDKSQKAKLHFRLGVSYRMKFDAENNPADFAMAVKHWRAAREINAGQYIWRRRIQQYGPVPDKPYPFYNWVAVATKEIQQRGEKPVALKVPLSTSELAGKGSLPLKTPVVKKPNLAGITEDSGNIEIQPVLLPDTSGKKPIYRVHLLLKPKPEATYQWNNEVGPIILWLESADKNEGFEKGVLLPVDPAKPTSAETRSAEFEWNTNDAKELKGVAIYHVCDKSTGVCTVLKQRFSISQ